MLFRQRFQAGIRDGSITRTLRAWESPRVQVGKSYRLGPDGAVEVRAVATVSLGELTAADARKSGFTDRGELLAELERSARRRLTANARLFRVDFRWIRSVDPRAARRADTSGAALEEIAARLARMDRLSRRGPWTRKVLRLIEKQPRVAASRLAPRMDRELRAFKADVRKLKELGLTVSHEIGYSLSPRGKALLARHGRWE